MREYAVTSVGAVNTAGTTVTGGVSGNTLVFINPAAAPNVNIEFLRYWAGQASSTTSAQQRAGLVSQVTAFPTLTGATPASLKRQQGASVIASGTAGAAGTAGINASAEGAGAKTTIWEDDFNVLNGYLRVATPAETEIFPAGSASGAGFWFPIAPTTTNGWSFGVNFREV